MRAFLAALGFLTILPVPSDEKDLSRSVAWFPIVGLLIGGLAAILDWALGRVFPPLVSSVLIVIALIGISGGLHLDGLADTADGFLSSRPRERVLEIMRDSRIGTMGTLAIVSVFALKVACLSAVVGTPRLGIVLLMPIAGRCAMVMAMAIIPYARPEGGLGSAFAGNQTAGAIVSLAVLAIAGWLAMGRAGLISGALAVCIGCLMANWSFRKIGGFTGDVLGAVCEIAEIAPALVAAALVHLW